MVKFFGRKTDFGKTYRFLATKLEKMPIMAKNCKFWPKSQTFWQKFDKKCRSWQKTANFSREVILFGKNMKEISTLWAIVWRKNLIMVNNCTFSPKSSIFWQKYEENFNFLGNNLNKNANHGKKTANFSRKYQFFGKNMKNISIFWAIIWKKELIMVKNWKFRPKNSLFWQKFEKKCWSWQKTANFSRKVQFFGQ